MVAAIPARMSERRMKKSPADEGDASRESGGRRNPGACYLLCHNSSGRARFAGRRSARQKRGPLCGPLLRWRYGFSAVMMMMPANVPARTAVGEPDRLQLEIGYPGRDVQAGLDLHADALQRIG